MHEVVNENCSIRLEEEYVILVPDGLSESHNTSTIAPMYTQGKNLR